MDKVLIDQLTLNGHRHYMHRVWRVRRNKFTSVDEVDNNKASGTVHQCTYVNMFSAFVCGGGDVFRTGTIRLDKATETQINRA